MRTPRRLIALSLASLLLGGCAVRTQFQGCVIRCPDAMKDPDQIEAEGERDVLETYAWTALAGAVSCADCRITTWTAPAATGSYTVSVTVRDGRGGEIARSVAIFVTTQ